MAMPRWLTKILTHYGMAYEARHHLPVHSASHLAHMEHISGYRVAKTVFLWRRGRPIAVVLPACLRLDVERVQAVLGTADCRLASEAEIAHWFKGCEPGLAPPLRLRADERILMDRSLATVGNILFAAGTPEDSVVVSFRDWYRAIRPGVGHFTVPNRRQANGQAPPTVLVVEDEADTKELLCQLLKRQGLVPRGVEAGRQALVLASEIRPAAILLDLMLPDMSGFDVCERMRRSGPVKRIPVIVVTALDDEASRRRSLLLGAEAYLTKPFPPERLMAEVTGALADARR